MEALGLAWAEWPWLAAMGWAIDRPAAPADQPVWGFARHTPAGERTDLSEALHLWSTDHQGAVRPAVSINRVENSRLPWLWIAFGLVVVGWRALAAARIVHWQYAAQQYRIGSPSFQIALWFLLLLTYYYVTFPPLIVLCWSIAALLCLADPRPGLWIAAAALPFLFQHKELHLVDMTIAVSPSAAATLVLLPGLARRWWRHGLALQPLDWCVLALFPLSLLAAPSCVELASLWDRHRPIWSSCHCYSGWQRGR